MLLSVSYMHTVSFSWKGSSDFYFSDIFFIGQFEQQMDQIYWFDDCQILFFQSSKLIEKGPF